MDLAPTILKILGIKAPPMDGRVLTEAMVDGSAPENSRTEMLEASREFPHAIWRQYLKVLHVGQTIYFDEGNGILASIMSSKSLRLKRRALVIGALCNR